MYQPIVGGVSVYSIKKKNDEGVLCSHCDVNGVSQTSISTTNCLDLSPFVPVGTSRYIYLFIMNG